MIHFFLPDVSDEYEWARCLTGMFVAKEFEHLNFGRNHAITIQNIDTWTVHNVFRGRGGGRTGGKSFVELREHLLKNLHIGCTHKRKMATFKLIDRAAT